MHVAFFRNLNQGQRGHPRTADLVAAFAGAGAAGVTPVQSNGTVAFSAVDPDGVVGDVAAALAARGLYGDVIMLRPLDFVDAVVAAHRTRAEATRCELTLFDPSHTIGDASRLRLETARRGCDVLDHGAGWALVRNGADRQSNGTPAIEACLSAPATSRGIPTLIRLVDRLAG